MRFFVSNDIFQILRIQLAGKIYFGLYKSQYKGSAYLLTLKNLLFVPHCRGKFSVQPPKTESSIKEYYEHSQNPEYFKNRYPYLKWICTFAGFGCKRLLKERIDCHVKCIYSAVNGRRHIHFDIHWNSLGAWNQTPCTLNGKRTKESYGNNPPKENTDPFRGFFQKKAQHQHSQYHPASRYANVNCF